MPPPTYAFHRFSDDQDEVTATHSPEPSLIARARMKSVTMYPSARDSGLHSLDLDSLDLESDLDSELETLTRTDPPTGHSSLPAPRYSMRVPIGTTVYSEVAPRTYSAPPPSLAAPPLPTQRLEQGCLPVSALRVLLARLTECAGPAARPMMLVEMEALGARPDAFPRVLAGELLTRLAERLDVTDTRRRFIVDGRQILDKELYVQVPRG